MLILKMPGTLNILGRIHLLKYEKIIGGKSKIRRIKKKTGEKNTHEHLLVIFLVTMNSKFNFFQSKLTKLAKNVKKQQKKNKIEEENLIKIFLFFQRIP
jgi:hypothetical protein